MCWSTFKIINLQCSWLKQLFDDSFHEWKVIPFFYIKKVFGNNFKFHSDLDYKFRNNVLLSKFYEKILSNWIFTLIHLQSSPLVFWTNFYGTIKMCELTKKTVFFKRFSEHNVNFVMDLLDNSGKFKSWHVFKAKYKLNHKFYFQWLQLTDAKPKAWKNIVQNDINNNGSLTIKDHRIIQKTRIISLNKLERVKCSQLWCQI